jgi:hypothetical protein
MGETCRFALIKGQKIALKPQVFSHLLKTGDFTRRGKVGVPALLTHRKECASLAFRALPTAR